MSRPEGQHTRVFTTFYTAQRMHPVSRGKETLHLTGMTAGRALTQLNSKRQLHRVDRGLASSVASHDKEKLP